MIGTIVILMLFGLAVLFVSAPLRRPATEEMSGAASPVEQALEKKSAALTAIVDLEEEAEVGKLTAAELDDLRRDYERDALDALEELDRLEMAPSSDESLELEIAEMRARLACPSCGAVREPDGTCARCDA